jgi:type VI secretion system secreted protein Hcp
MAIDVYVSMKDIKGESTDKEHEGWLEAINWDFGMQQPSSATASTAGGGTAERVQYDSFNFTQLVNLASPKIYEYCSQGKHIPEVVIQMYRASGEKRVKYMEVKLKTVVVSAVHAGHSDTTGFPTETVSMTFGAITWTYEQQKRDGSNAGKSTGAWSLVQNVNQYAA